MIPQPSGNEGKLAFDVAVPKTVVTGPVEDFNLLFPDT